MPHLSSMLYSVKQQMTVAQVSADDAAYFRYDFTGQRIRKVVADVTVPTSKVIKEERIYIGNYEVYRKYVGGTLNLERITVHIADDTGRIAMYEECTEGSDGSDAVLTRYIYNNHLGSASLELDGSGAIISYEEYHPYGTTAYRAMSSSIKAIAKRYRYTGKERDEETGLYYHGARYYIPWLCRWSSVDPKQGEMPVWSPYNYGFCNPVTWADSTGMQPDGDTALNNSIAQKISGYIEYKSKNDDTASAGYTAEQSPTFANLMTKFATGAFRGSNLSINAVSRQGMTSTSDSAQGGATESSVRAGTTLVNVIVGGVRVPLSKFEGSPDQVDRFEIEIKINQDIEYKEQAVALIHEVAVHAEKFAAIITNSNLSTQEKVAMLQTQSEKTHHNDIFDPNSSFNKMGAEVLSFLKGQQDFNNSEPMAELPVEEVSDALSEEKRSSVGATNNSAYNRFVQTLNIFTASIKKLENRADTTGMRSFHRGATVPPSNNR